MEKLLSTTNNTLQVAYMITIRVFFSEAKKKYVPFMLIGPMTYIDE